ncbi:NAD(P) transhydrogenase subunit beta (macronuclear) [Tetrahymena thermophila SB210]|uniref:proton-translocating NAD(P)(+) transhydrogenase n=1 Tax=Tetrahymena thermophila (strain SB210) TaxID=312017 RepID=I7ML24_TETTS|nr:NAD(P) transhydrogenase subunit beta [Tetrahymena thermophila SB210]EAS01032.2 NAD(P) transhydrogenase subunit beta [Tetrahymena thermophila SB210]|eukprot:XP_001021277.2 NAD(P) transhydrogenase subunit beta [Tetrahymena thermophila SB210]
MLRQHQGSFKTRTGHQKLKLIEEQSLPHESSEGLLDYFNFSSIKKKLQSWCDSIVDNDTVHRFLSKIGQKDEDKDSNDKSQKNQDSKGDDKKDNSDNKEQDDSSTKTDNSNKELKVNRVTDFQNASYFAASFMFILAIYSFSSAKTARRGVFIGLGGMILAIWASFFSSTWDLGDSFRWLVSFLVGGTIGLFAGLNAKMSQIGQTVCLLQAMVGAGCFLLGLAQYERYEYLKVEFEGFGSIQTVVVCWLGSTLFSSTLTSFYKLDKKNLAKAPLETIGKKRDLFNTIVIISIVVLSILYIWFNFGWTLWVIIFLSLYIGWGLTVSAQPKEMNIVVPCQTFLTGLTIVFVGFMLDRHYLLLVGALCITGGLSLTLQSAKGLNVKVHQVFFKSWSKSNADSEASQNHHFGYHNQLINENDLAHELLYNDKIVFVPGNGIYQTNSTQALSEISFALQHLGKHVTFCVHPCSGRIPGHIQAVLTSFDIPYSKIKQMNEVDFAEFDLAVVIGAYEEVDPDNLNDRQSSNYKMPTCKVWEATKVIYVETQIEKYKGNGLFDKQNISVMKGDANKLLSNIVKDFQRKGFTDMDPEERSLILQGVAIQAQSNLIPQQTANPDDLEDLVKKATRILGVYNEQSESNETRVAITPSAVKPLLKNGVHVWIEKDSGKSSGFSDEQYYKAGAKIATANEIFQNANILVFISQLKDKQINQIGKAVELLVAPLGKEKKQVVSKLAKNEKLTVVDLSDISPEVIRAQKLSTSANQETLSCYRSVFEGFYHLNKIARPVYNSTGRSPGAHVLVIGADHLGLTVASIAKQYGSIVRVYDRRDGLKHLIKKSGFIPVEFVYEIVNNSPNHVEEVQKNALKEVLKTTDLVITASFKDDGSATKVLNEELCSLLRRGSVIVDLAAEKGGNTSLTQLDKVNHDVNLGIHVIGYSFGSYCQKLNRQSSELHSLSINHLFNQIFLNKNLELGLVDLQDETLREVCYLHTGKDVSDRSFKKHQHDHEKLANESEIPDQSEQKLVEKQDKESDRKSIDIQHSEASVHLDGNNDKISEENKEKTFGEKFKNTLKKTGEYYENSKEYVLNFVSDQFSEKREEEINKNPGVFATLFTVFVLIFCLFLGVLTDSEFIFQLGLFILALFVGDTVIKQVDPGLNGPLLLFLQTLSGSIGIACMLIFSQEDNVAFFSAFTIIATVGNMLAMACVVGGFALTIRAVTNFTPREYRQIDNSE